MKRAAVLAATLLASACGGAASGNQQAAAATEASPAFECAVDGASDYGTGCTLERSAAADGMILTLRSPTGSFRRLRVARGRIAAADGAEPARIIAEDSNRVEVAVGGDRYRLPRQMLR